MKIHIMIGIQIQANTADLLVRFTKKVERIALKLVSKLNEMCFGMRIRKTEIEQITLMLFLAEVGQTKRIDQSIT